MSTKSICIIGASGVIGSAVARALDDQGFQLGLHYCNNIEACELLLSQCSSPNSHKLFHSSLNDPNDGKLLLQSMREELGDLYGLALCGGRVPWKNEENLAVEAWQNAFFELVIQPYGMALYFSQICAPKSRIVALSSISSNYGGSTTSRHYGAAKSALESSFYGLSRKLTQEEICVNIVRAGFILTPQQTKGRSPQEIDDRIQKIPFGRAGSPEEIANAFAFLFGKQSAFITGQCITVSGGD